MYSEDRVLIGAIQRKRDLIAVRDRRWYRIPVERLPRGLNADWMAFFMGRQLIRPAGVHFYAEIRGLELVRRVDLLPSEAAHPRAYDLYYRIALGPLLQRTPPITNPSGRAFAFIRTTGDRFMDARAIDDLYSTAEYYVDRLYYALDARKPRPDRG
ncbi:MAG: hypothetical protein SNJ59_05980 [Aggregatilineales bacterium]